MIDDSTLDDRERVKSGVGLDLAIVVMLSVVFLPLFAIHFIAAALAK